FQMATTIPPLIMYTQLPILVHALLAYPTQRCPQHHRPTAGYQRPQGHFHPPQRPPTLNFPRPVPHPRHPAALDRHGRRVQARQR
ncbi:hypothetical protein BCR44DRAFT_41083, partial [Catenaria anguillulae PL171]